MKRKITESQLRKIVSESVTQIIKENVLYCDVKPFQDIYHAAKQIMDKFSYIMDDNYEPSGDEYLVLQAYQWAKRVCEEADEWIQYNADNASVNGGENW